MIAVDGRRVRLLRARVRAAVRANPALRAESKRVKRRRGLAPTTARALTSGVMFLFVGVAYFSAVPFARIGDFFLLWALAFTLWRAQQIVTFCHHPNQLTVPYLLPLSDDAVFAAHRRFVWRASGWSAAETLGFGGLLAATLGHGLAAWLAVPLLTLAFWLGSLALGAALAWLRPGWNFGLGAFGVIMFGVLTVWTSGHAEFYRSTLAPCYAALRAGTPVGWMAWALEDAFVGRGWPGLVVLAGLAGSSALALPRIVLALRAQFQPDRIFGYEETPAGEAMWEPAEPERAAELAQAAATTPLPPAEATPPVDRAKVAAALRLVLEQPAGLALFDRGYFERWIVRCLSLRQRIIVDFMRPVGWSLSRRLALALGVVVLARVFLAGLAHDSDLHALGVGTVALAALVALPIVGGRWLGFDVVQLENMQAGVYAFTPLGFGEIARTMLTVNFLRIAATVPVFLLAAWLGFARTPLPFAQALDYTARGLGLVVALQPLMIVFQFSRQTNDSSARWWLSALIIVVLVACALGGVGLAIAALAIESPLTALGCSAGFAGMTTAVLLLYGWGWNRAWFDLSGKLRT